MNFKKYLKTPTGQAWIEYLILFAIVATVVFVSPMWQIIWEKADESFKDMLGRVYK